MARLELSLALRKRQGDHEVGRSSPVEALQCSELVDEVHLGPCVAELSCKDGDGLTLEGRPLEHAINLLLRMTVFGVCVCILRMTPSVLHRWAKFCN